MGFTVVGDVGKRGDLGIIPVLGNGKLYGLKFVITSSGREELTAGRNVNGVVGRIFIAAYVIDRGTILIVTDELSV